MLVSSIPNVPSPSHEVIQSIDERPGSLNIGLITFVNNEPKNSRSPKFKSNGNNKPANKKIENKTVNKSFNTKAPVNSPLINSGPIPKSANKLNIPPNTLAASHKGPTLNNVFKNLFSKINFGLNILVIVLITAEITKIKVIM